MAFRAFLAVDVGPVPGLVDLHDELDRIDAALKTVEPQKFHVTMKFLGDVARDRVPEIQEAMDRATDGIEPFTARLVGVGAFPSQEFIKVVWAGMTGAEPLSAIAERLEEDLAHIEKVDHEFTPHVTLARMKGGGGKDRVQAFLDDHRDEAFGEVPIEALKLEESELKPDGPVYSTVEEAPLDG